MAGLKRIEAADTLLNGIFNGIFSAMTATVTIDTAGRLVLPKAMRERLHLSAGSKLRADVVADRIELTVTTGEGIKLVRRGKRMVLAGVRPTGDIVDGLRADREERIEHIRPK